MRYLFSWYTTYIYSFFIVVVALLPVRFPPQLLFSFQDKIIHGLIYFLLAFLIVNTFSRKKIGNSRKYSFVYVFCLGLVLEMVHYFLPYRSFEFGDILANSIGGFLGVLLVIKKPLRVNFNYRIKR
ncbi:MAG: VanZ family protein [Candidatus Omnitrophica bacterium]|nr:VanZ family protein [Candidatus Omnitrophota bacterium]